MRSDSVLSNARWPEIFLGCNAPFLINLWIAKSGRASCTLRVTVHVAWPDIEYASAGFRVASIPEPCSLVLLSFGVLTLRRRRRV